MGADGDVNGNKVLDNEDIANFVNPNNENPSEGLNGFLRFSGVESACANHNELYINNVLIEAVGELLAMDGATDEVLERNRQEAEETRQALSLEQERLAELLEEELPNRWEEIQSGTTREDFENKLDEVGADKKTRERAEEQLSRLEGFASGFEATDLEGVDAEGICLTMVPLPSVSVVIVPDGGFAPDTGGARPILPGVTPT